MNPSVSCSAPPCAAVPFPSRGRLAALSVALVLGACLLLPRAHAQAAATGAIEGRIQNAGTGVFLNNARVAVQGTAKEAYTDAAGAYRIDGVPAGPATLDVFYTGMEPQQVAVTVPAGATATQDVGLVRAGAAPRAQGEVVTLDPFVVATEREYNATAIAINEQRFAANKKEVVSTDALGEINQGNIGEFVKHLPGITFEMKDGNNLSGIMVRGFNSNYTNVTFDGGQVASAALSNTQTHTRQFVLEQANINNIARIEVVKLPTPDMAANLLGGAVNFISRSAFESPRPKFDATFYLSANEKAFDFEETPGPGRGEDYKIRPSARFSYLHPVNDRLGFVVNAASNSQYYLQNRTVYGRRFSGSGASLANPQTNSIATSFSPNLQTSHSVSGKVDWKPWDGNTVSVSAEANAFEQQQATRTITYNVGNATPTSWGETFTNGGAATGTTSLGNSFQGRHGLTRRVAASWDLDRGPWAAQLAGSFSHSASNSRDMAKGFFRGVSTANRAVRQVQLQDINNEDGSVGTIVTLDANGNPVDATQLSNYNLTTVQGEPQSAEDTLHELRARVTRDLDVFNVPVKLTLGGSRIEVEREIDYNVTAYTYVGADGVAANDDNVITPFPDPGMAGASPGFGQRGVQWPSPWAIFDAWKANPNLFTRTPSQQGDSVRNNAVRSPLVTERITAGYLMGDTKLFNRVRLVGGVRYELTENWGWGSRQDSSAVFQRDANGDLIKVNGAFVRKPEAGAAGSAESERLIWTYRGQYGERDYDDFFPSLHSTIEILENLQLRVAYAETIGRPRIVDIVPNLSVSDNVAFDPSQSSSFPGFITSANTTLRPWTGKNYDYALEYYLPRNGVVSFSYFKKDIKDFFANLNSVADAALLDQLGLSQDYVGYRYTTRINVGDARIEGWEANLILPLANLARWTGQVGADSWLNHFTIRGNITRLDLTGSRVGPSDFGNYIPKAHNIGLNFAFPRLTGNVLFNHKGKMLRDDSSAFPDAFEYIRARNQLDADVNWQFSRHFTLFVAGRNILNDTTRWEVSGPGAPSWAFLTNYEDYGAQYSFGIKASY
ncbi:MAG TPA: TonB-dependent receptor [Opitutaceae bacterium]|nr:TonB-dependent receptor [Opitutaceae bacterium]